MIIKFEKRTILSFPVSWTQEEIEAHNKLIEMQLAEDMKKLAIFVKETSAAFQKELRPPGTLAGITRSTT